MFSKTRQNEARFFFKAKNIFYSPARHMSAIVPRLEGGQWVSFDELETAATGLCSFCLGIFLFEIRDEADGIE